MLSKGFYEQNRQKFIDAMKEQSLAFLFSGELIEQSRDANYPFFPNANCYYVTGIETEGLIYMVSKLYGSVEEHIFIDRINERKEKFDGKMPTLESTSELYGVPNIHYKDELDAMIGRLLYDNDVHHIYLDLAKWKMSYPPKPADVFAAKIIEKFPYLKIENAHSIIAEFRLRRDDEEVDAIRKATEITEAGVKAMLDHMKPGMKEYQIEAYFNFVLTYNGVHEPGFETIAGSGPNTCCMHYHKKDRTTQDGDLLLLDLGAKWEGYSCDVTRTYPVNGVYTKRQKQIYETVLTVQERVIRELFRPGVEKMEVFRKTKEWMGEEGVKRGLFERPEEVEDHYWHGPTHPVGLDVHDVGYTNCPFEPNMVYAFEPGIYFPEEGIGVRIEDTILITEDGCEVLSSGIPKTVEEVEAYFKNRKEA